MNVMELSKKNIIDLLNQVKLEDSQEKSIAESIKYISLESNKLSLEIIVNNPTLQFKEKVKSKICTHLIHFFRELDIEVKFSVDKINHRKESNNLNTVSKVKNIIAISSGKGGVGKSTIASNIAISLQKAGFDVGLIDADIFGPSIPLMFDAVDSHPEQEVINSKKFIKPIISYGVKIMSIGFFSNPDEAIVWRGPMATKALKTITLETNWGDLDFLLIDLPPGTSDIHLSLVQLISVTGSIIVTTPQQVSLIDASKAISMFSSKNINVPILGVVENMAWHEIDGVKHYIFGRDGGKNLAENKTIPLLAEIPLHQSIRESGDVGRPAALQNSNLSKIFENLSKNLVSQINDRNDKLPTTKKVEISHNRGCK